MKDERNRWKGRGGFTLPEVLIAMLVLAIGAAAAASFVGTIRRGAAFTSDFMLGASFAESKIEQFAVAPYAEMAGGSDSSGRYGRSWTVSPSGTVNQIVVSVRWTDIAGRTHGVTLNSARSP